MVMNITEASWLDIERLLPPYGNLNAKRVDEGTCVLLAVDHDARRHALLPLEKIDEAFFDDKSRGLTVGGRELEVEGSPKRLFLDIECTDRSGNDAFNLVVSDILRRVAAGDGHVEAVKTTLNHWRRFWQGGNSSGLTPDQVLGLFGELWFLSVWLMPRGLPNVGHWVGPSAARNDFQWPNLSVEAKATKSVRGHIHRINGLDQLDPPEGGGLYLFSLRVREEQGSKNSLVSLVERISDMLYDEPELMDLFEDSLARAGYSPVHAERYSQMRFRVIEERLYRVGEGFPRLSVASFSDGVPRGVERVDYEINLETCPELWVGRSSNEPGVNLEP
jgi:hypothetical protein